MYQNIFSCNGKNAVVTGGSGLLGKEIVKGLAEFGATVYIADRKNDTAFRTINRSAVQFVPMDIQSEISVVKTLDQITKKCGTIDILINCAYPRTNDWGQFFEHIPVKSFNENVKNHLGGYFLCCQKIAEIMKRQKKGSIINFASIYGIVAPDFSIYEGTEMTMPAAYSAIKGGIIALTRYIATYYGKYNVRANVISPGGILNNQAASFVKKYSRHTPQARMGKPGDIVGAALYLASDASSYVTGHNLIIDGGWTAW